MKRVLGLDLGTNSIGWSLIETDFDKKEGSIKGLGSRIIPMDQGQMSDFGKGNSISQTADRTKYRGVRRLIQRNLLRRERLHRVLNVLGFLPKHFADSIDFEKHFGQFKGDEEVKLNYRKNEQGKHEFIFMDSFNEMVKEFEAKGQPTKIPYDWTLYYLRKKALTQKISKEELAWLILNFNQKRGYYQLRGEEEENDTKNEDYYALKVKDVVATEDKNAKGIWYNVILENDWVYRRQSNELLDSWIGKIKEFIVTTNKEKDGTLKLDKEGNVKRSFRAVDSEKDWIAIKTKTEQDIDKTGKTVGQYIYEALLENPNQKIRGKLVKTIERKFYKEEFEQILKTQIEHHKELLDRNLFQTCIDELYPRNEAHQINLKDKGFDYLFKDDIIFYQRPLKSKKSTISGCQYETRKYQIEVIDKVTNEKRKEWVTEPLKAIPKSHPLFQEFRLWQFLKNLKIYQKEDEKGNLIDNDITDVVLSTEEVWVELFEFLSERSKIKQSQIIDFFIKKKRIEKKNKDKYRWNYVEDKEYPCNETRAQFINRLKKVKDLNIDTFLTAEMEYKLWHIIYSVTDKNEFERAIENFAERNNIDQVSFEKSFKKFPPYKSDFGAYSEKAIKKLLPLMRRSKYWDKNKISQDVTNRIENIMERVETLNLPEQPTKTQINAALEKHLVADDDIPTQLIKSFIPFKNTNPLTVLNTYQACYAIYNRHSEAGNIQFWKTPSDIDKYLLKFKQHSLRNPIVEKVVTETLRTVRDIWKHYGNGEENFFKEIHVELGREMKNPADKRKKMTAQISENENTNQRIKAILQELKDGGISDVKPYSPSQQEILKIYEEGIYQSVEVADDIEKIRKNNAPTKAEINKYKLWLEQGYVSPYTGQTIPLSMLFTTAYQIEHIIPQSRYFNNSMSNKVICESEINPNPYKDNQTGYEFIKKQGGQIIPELSTSNKTVKLYTLEQYESHCNKYFKKNRTKLKNLLSEDIPEGFINRQLNDSRYISTLIKGLLSNLVREENEKEATSKHIVPVTGSITFKLKQDWGLNDKWNELITPRFERLNKLTNSNDFGYWDYQKDENGNNVGKQFFRTQVPNEIAKGFNKKRIDHRHHALDALVIACCTKKHTNYLGALNAEKKNYGLRDTLLIKSKEDHYTKHFLMPWNGFTTEAKNQLEKIVISFKQNTRVINKTNNKTLQWVEKEGKWKKQLVLQTKGDNWAIRKPMHKETVSGKVILKREKGEITFNKAIENWKMIVDKSIKNKVKGAFVLFDNDLKKVKTHFKNNPIKIDDKEIKKILVYENIEATATRTVLTDKFTRKHLESITDTGIQKILENHIKNYIDDKGKEQFDLAFSPEGVEELNKNILVLNNGKKHQPIFKVRLYEVGSKFKVGLKGNRKDKYVEAAKGTNLFFAIYKDEKENRKYETILLNEVIEHQKWRAALDKKERDTIPMIPIKSIFIERGKEVSVQFLFSLSPNDLVYVPTDEEVESLGSVDFTLLSKEQVERVYKMVSCTGSECHFIPNQISSEIRKNENGTNSKNERIQDFFDGKTTLDMKMKPIMIKNQCWKLKVDRLGNVARVRD
ncbi:MAG: CRISPR-associated protein Csn1 [Flavobacteriaceae bacterium]|nr:CRISPR-associated protein Csn1 [Flavobacteriaceae bacterium]